MKKVVAVVAVAVGLTACGVEGTEVDVDRDGDVCTVTISKNIPGNNDEDNTFVIPCEIPERQE